MTTPQQWYEDMAEAMKKRERAKTQIASWTRKLSEAEDVIATLTTNPAHAPELTEEP